MLFEAFTGCFLGMVAGMRERIALNAVNGYCLLSCKKHFCVNCFFIISDASARFGMAATMRGCTVGQGGRGRRCRSRTTSTRTPTTAACGCSMTTKSLPSEPELGTSLGVSRTTVRAILARMEEMRPDRLEQAQQDGPARAAARRLFPRGRDRHAGARSSSAASCARLLAGGAEAGMQINELELAREIGVGTTSVREFLIRFSPLRPDREAAATATGC